jgi:hypothetical protein
MSVSGRFADDAFNNEPSAIRIFFAAFYMLLSAQGQYSDVQNKHDQRLYNPEFGHVMNNTRRWRL